MTLNTKALEAECATRGWAITVEFDESRYLITGSRTSVSVTITPNGEAHLYAAGPFGEVVDVIRVVEKHTDGR